MTKQELDNRFIYHKPIGNQPSRYEAIRNLAKDLAVAINELCPESREKSNAFTDLESSVMWANASIARNEGEDNSTRPIPGMNGEQSAAWALGYRACHESMSKRTTPCCEFDTDFDGNCARHKFTSKKTVTRADLAAIHKDLLELCGILEKEMPASALASKMTVKASVAAGKLQSFLYATEV